MTSFELPATGLTLEHDTVDSSKQIQIIKLALSNVITTDLIRSLKRNEKLRLRLGPKPAVVIGKRSVPINHSTDPFPTLLYSNSSESNKKAMYVGSVDHILEVQQAKEALNKVQQMNSALRANVDSLKAMHATRDYKPGTAMYLSGAQQKTLLGSRSSGPLLSAAPSRIAPTSNPLSPAVSPKEKMRRAAAKIAMSHLLAIEPLTPKEIQDKLKVKQADCDFLIQQFTQDAPEGKGKKALRNRYFKDLDVWKFNYTLQADRQRAIDNSAAAFDRLRLPSSDESWQMLYQEQDRGKGQCLSKLDFGKELTTVGRGVKIPERSTDGTSSTGISRGSDPNKTPNAAAMPKRRDITKGARPEKLVKTQVKKSAKEEHPVTEGSKKRTVDGGMVNKSKIKSAERIVDSDEEVAEVKVAPAPKVPEPVSKRDLVSNDPILGRFAKRPTTIASPRPSTPLQRPQQSKHDLPSSKMAKTRAGTDTSDARRDKASARKEASPSRQVKSKVVPTKMGEAESSSASRSAVDSSAASTPPSSTDLSKARKPEFKPVSTFPKRVDQPEDRINKRKLNDQNNEPTAKRRQVEETKVNPAPKKPVEEAQRKTTAKNPPEEMRPNGVAKKAVKEEGTNGTAKTSVENTISESRRAQNGDTSRTMSASSSSTSTKDPKREEVELSAKKFNASYEKYKKLHDKLQNLSVEDRDDEDIDRLWQMHERLAEWKKDLADDWTVVEEIESRRD